MLHREAAFPCDYSSEFVEAGFMNCLISHQINFVEGWHRLKEILECSVHYDCLQNYEMSPFPNIHH